MLCSGSAELVALMQLFVMPVKGQIVCEHGKPDNVLFQLVILKLLEQSTFNRYSGIIILVRVSVTVPNALEYRLIAVCFELLNVAIEVKVTETFI